MTITTDRPATVRTVSAARLSFTTDRAALADALTTVGLVVPKRPPLPILGGVLLQARKGHLTVSATDYETAVTVRVPGAVQTAGTVLVDHSELARLLGALVKGSRKRDADALPVTVRTLDDGTAVVDLAGYTMPVTSFPAADYPTIPDAAPPVASVERERFTQEMARVMIAVGTDDTVPMLTGVNFKITADAVTLAATDRYRLAIAPLPATSTGRTMQTASALVPGHLVAPVVKRFGGDRVHLGFDDAASPSVVSLACGDVTVSVRTLDAEMPPYQTFIPETAAGIVQTGRAALLAATRRAAAVLDAKRDRDGHIVLTVTRESLSVAPVIGHHADVVAAPEQAATVDGITDTAAFWFKPAYLTDALTSFTGETVTLHTQTTVTRPVLLTDTPDGINDRTAFCHVIVPVRAPQD